MMPRWPNPRQDAFAGRGRMSSAGSREPGSAGPLPRQKEPRDRPLREAACWVPPIQCGLTSCVSPQFIDMMGGGKRQQDQHREQNDHQDRDDREHFFSPSPRAGMAETIRIPLSRVQSFAADPVFCSFATLRSPPHRGYVVNRPSVGGPMSDIDKGHVRTTVGLWRTTAAMTRSLPRVRR
jgi:hypothetical protein